MGIFQSIELEKALVGVSKLFVCGGLNATKFWFKQRFHLSII